MGIDRKPKSKLRIPIQAIWSLAVKIYYIILPIAVKIYSDIVKPIFLSDPWLIVLLLYISFVLYYIYCIEGKKLDYI